MLVELRVAEQRYRAVREVLEGASVTEVARRFGVSRQSVHAWLRRYAADGGLGGLGDRSSRPHSCSHQMSPATEARIVEIRRAHPVWGADRIRYQLRRDKMVLMPGRTSVYRALPDRAFFRTRKRSIVTGPDCVLLNGSRSILPRPEVEKRTPSPSSTGKT